MQQRIVCGSRWITVELPERTQMVSPGGMGLPLEPVADIG